MSEAVYIRHRDRMVQESVSEDLINTLIACRWMAGTTSRPVVSPYDRPAGWQTVTTAPTQVLKAVGSHPVKVIGSFPEASGEDAPEIGDTEAGTTSPNTLAMDDGQAGTPERLELGSDLMEVPYKFTLAFYGANVGVSQAVMNDLRDRYLGRIVSGDFINLYDYLTDPNTPVVRMEVLDFQYLRDVETVAPNELTMFYGQLTLSDFVE